MSEDEKQVTPTPEEGEDKTKENEGLEQGVDIKSALAQKEHFRKKAEQAQKELEELKAKDVKVGEPEEKSVPKQPSTDDAWKKKIEFAIAHPELGAEAVQEVLDHANVKGISPDEAMESPVLKPYLDSVKQEKAVQSASPSQSGRSPKAQPVKPVEEMSEEEHKEYFKKMLGNK